jgi:hypothetical protein
MKNSDHLTVFACEALFRRTKPRAAARLTGARTRSNRRSWVARVLAACMVLSSLPSFANGRETNAVLPSLQVSPNGRYLTNAAGEPFFYLADTAWELFHRLSRSEAETYFRTRASQGFNVVQAVALAELDGLRTPNAHGDLPLIDDDPARPAVTPGDDPAHAGQYDYWDHVDYIVDLAASHGIYMAILPTWGDKWNRGKGPGPEVFTPANAEIYGRWLGERYRDRSIIWLLGGDRFIETDRHHAIIRAMAKGIAIGSTGAEAYDKVLMSFHPRGGESSSTWFHDEPWISFNMQQNGHCTNVDVWNRVRRDYDRKPVKPVIDGEPLYENHPICFAYKRGISNDDDVRRFAWWSVFSGAFGHTYGNHSVWQMADAHREPVNGPQGLHHRVANRMFRSVGVTKRVSRSMVSWRRAIRHRGARQMRFVRQLMESRPFTTRVPDNSLVTSNLRHGSERIAATRDASGTYAFVYSAAGRPFRVDLSRISGPVRAWWYDPRTGRSTDLGTFLNRASREFKPPGHGRDHDWVLVLDDSTRGYGAPGETAQAMR